MKTLLAAIILMSLTITAFATDFETIAQAEAHCPAAINGLTYHQEKARITGLHGSQFTSTKIIAGSAAPQLLNDQKIIMDATFRNQNEKYGYMTDDAHVTCLYSYETKAGLSYALIMRNF